MIVMVLVLGAVGLNWHDIREKGGVRSRRGGSIFWMRIRNRSCDVSHVMQMPFRIRNLLCENYADAAAACAAAAVANKNVKS